MADLISFLNPVSPYDQQESDGWDQAARNMGWTGAGAGALAGVLGLSDIARNQLGGARYFRAMQRAAEIDAAKRANAEIANIIRSQLTGQNYQQRPRATGYSGFDPTFTRQNTIEFPDVQMPLRGQGNINYSPTQSPYGPLVGPALEPMQGRSVRRNLRRAGPKGVNAYFGENPLDSIRTHHNSIIETFGNQPKPIRPKSKAKAAVAAHDANMAIWLENQRLVEESKKWLAENPNMTHAATALRASQPRSQQPSISTTSINETGRIEGLRGEAKKAAEGVNRRQTQQSGVNTLSQRRQQLIPGAPTVEPANTGFGKRSQAGRLLRDIEKAGKEKLNPRPAGGSGFLDVVGGWENVKSTAQKANQKLGKIGKVASIASIPVGAAGAWVTQWIAENRAKQEQEKQKPQEPTTQALSPTQRATISRQEFGKRVDAWIKSKGLDSSNIRSYSPANMMMDFKKLGGSDKDIADMVKLIYGQATKK